jgi:hypothetical protein
MPSFSETRITRTAAKKYLFDRIMTGFTDEELENTINDLEFEKRLRSCKIVNDSEYNEDYLLD